MYNCSILYGQGCDPAVFKNYYILDTLFVSTEKSFITSDQLKVQFYKDSVPDKSLLRPKPLNLRIGPVKDTIFILNEWANFINFSDLRLISITNVSSIRQNIPVKYNACHLRKAIITPQIKDEFGYWNDLENSEIDDLGYSIPYKIIIDPSSSINVIVRLPVGDFETDIRFKILINLPPDWPVNKYIFSPTYKFSIDKTSIIE